ncbi:MAG: hypothetical protein FWF35_05840 [Elusimicrobia bacterium]|nr:hypothetical protein [Elusimicrobiota bacterium]
MKNVKNILAVLLSGGLFACAGTGYVAYPSYPVQSDISYSTGYYGSYGGYYPQPSVYSYSNTSYNTGYPSPVIIRNRMQRPFYSYSNTERPYRSSYRGPGMNFPVTNDNQRDIWVNPNRTGQPFYQGKQNSNMKPGFQSPRPGQNYGQRNGQVNPYQGGGSNGQNQNRPAGQQGNNGGYSNNGNSGAVVNPGSSGNNGNGNNGVHNGITQGNGSNGVGNQGGQTRLPPGQAKKN